MNYNKTKHHLIDAFLLFDIYNCDKINNVLWGNITSKGGDKSWKEQNVNITTKDLILR